MCRLLQKARLHAEGSWQYCLRYNRLVLRCFPSVGHPCHSRVRSGSAKFCNPRSTGARDEGSCVSLCSYLLLPGVQHTRQTKEGITSELLGSGVSGSWLCRPLNPRPQTLNPVSPKPLNPKAYCRSFPGFCVVLFLSSRD